MVHLAAVPRRARDEEAGFEVSRARMARAAAATSGAAITPAHTAALTSSGVAFFLVMPPMQKNGTPSFFSAAR